MRIIDWRALLQKHHVPSVERGANVKRGEINIRCPFCGSADPSFHMGLSVDTGEWACWRNDQHRGKSPVRLLIKLLRISYAAARELAGLGDGFIDPDGFTAAVAKLRGEYHSPATHTDALTIPDSFGLLAPSGATRRHWEYLRNRGFSEIDALVDSYLLMADKHGSFTSRVILPYLVDSRLVAWTGRAIGPSEIRYKDLSLRDCVVPIKHTLYNHDAMLDEGVKHLVVVEGPIDVLKMDFYGRDFGVRAVGLSTNSMTEQQIAALHNAVVDLEIPDVVVMMDNASSLHIVHSMRLKARLEHVPRTRILPTPYGAKDAGELTPEQVARFCMEIEA